MFNLRLGMAAAAVFVLGGSVKFLNQNYDMIFHGGSRGKATIQAVLDAAVEHPSQASLAVKRSARTCLKDVLHANPDEIVLHVTSSVYISILESDPVKQGRRLTPADVDAARDAERPKLEAYLLKALAGISGRRKAQVEEQFRFLKAHGHADGLRDCVFKSALDTLKLDGAV